MSKLQALIHDGRIDPLLLAPADGDETLKSVVSIGKNPDVDTGSEDLIDGGGTLVVPTAARVHAVVSSNTADVGGKQATGTITITDYAQMLAAAARGARCVFPPKIKARKCPECKLRVLVRGEELKKIEDCEGRS